METNFRKNRFTGMGWAIFLICAGGLFLLFNLGIIPAQFRPILLSWQTLLIALGLWSLLTKKQPLGGIILIAIGALFLYSKLSGLYPGYLHPINFSLSTYWPIFLIGGGLFLLFGKQKFWNNKKHTRNYNNDLGKNISSDGFENSMDYLHKDIMFGGSEQIILSQNFKGGKTNLLFGELKIDLRNSKPAAPIIYLEVNVMFGSTIIYIPDNWVVNRQNTTILGEFYDKRYIRNRENEPNAPHLVITGGIMLGAGEIRN